MRNARHDRDYSAILDSVVTSQTTAGGCPLQHLRPLCSCVCPITHLLTMAANCVKHWRTVERYSCLRDIGAGHGHPCLQNQAVTYGDRWGAVGYRGQNHWNPCSTIQPQSTRRVGTLMNNSIFEIFDMVELRMGTAMTLRLRTV
ncbi:hypothetical protein AX17_004052 [Amanita inopinata Kibby_2008]|nr:hypothetical protein AX17_004052 [Amanita inopinata Kibby_2008]